VVARRDHSHRAGKFLKVVCPLEPTRRSKISADSCCAAAHAIHTTASFGLL
jgi:hypothetical protein